MKHEHVKLKDLPRQAELIGVCEICGRSADIEERYLHKHGNLTVGEFVSRLQCSVCLGRSARIEFRYPPGYMVNFHYPR